MLLSKCRCNRHLDFTKKLKIFCLQWTLDQKFSIFVIVFFQNKIFLFESEAFDAKRKAWCITHSKIQTLLILTVKPINIAQICKQTEYPKSTFSIALLTIKNIAALFGSNRSSRSHNVRPSDESLSSLHLLRCFRSL